MYLLVADPVYLQVITCALEAQSFERHVLHDQEQCATTGVQMSQSHQLCQVARATTPIQRCLSNPQAACNNTLPVNNHLVLLHHVPRNALNLAGKAHDLHYRARVSMPVTVATCTPLLVRAAQGMAATASSAQTL